MSWWTRFTGAFRLAFELKAEDIVVFVVGPSGGGKSWFIKAVTDSNHVIVGEDLTTCTKKVQAIRCELADEARVALRASENQRFIVFVDTPSLHDGDGDEIKAMRRWLKKSKPKSTLVGIIYVDRIASVHIRSITIIKDHLSCFVKTFPSTENFRIPRPLQLRGVLSYNAQEGIVKEESIISRKDIFQSQLDKVVSGTFYRHRSANGSAPTQTECLQRDGEEAWNAVVALFSQRIG